MLSPYALTRPGGVQGQVIGLSRALRGLGHDLTVVGPADSDVPLPQSLGEHYVIGRPTGVHSNGSVAPVALRPSAVARAERFVRKGGFDVVHIHEPLAPLAAYGLVLTDPLPMVGTYHRSGLSSWVRPLKPLVELVGRRMEVRVAVSSAARETGERSSGGRFEVLYNGVDVERFGSALPVRDDHEPRRPPSCSSDVTSSARASACCSMPSRWWSGRPCCGWPAKDRKPRCNAGVTLSPTASIGSAPSARKKRRHGWQVPTCSALRRCTENRSASCSSRAWRRAARWWRRTSRATAWRPAAMPRSCRPARSWLFPGRSASRLPMPSKASDSLRPRHARPRPSTAQLVDGVLGGTVRRGLRAPRSPRIAPGGPEPRSPEVRRPVARWPKAGRPSQPRPLTTCHTQHRSFGKSSAAARPARRRAGTVCVR